MVIRHQELAHPWSSSILLPSPWQSSLWPWLSPSAASGLFRIFFIVLLAFAFWAFIGEEVTPGALLAAALALPAAFALTLDFAFTLALAFAFGAAVSKNSGQLMGQFLLEKPVLQILVLVQVEAKCKHSIRWTSRPLHEVTNRGDKWQVTSILSTTVLHRLYMHLYNWHNFQPFTKKVAQIPKTSWMYQPAIVILFIHKRCCMRFLIFGW
mgnify:CR=1 FL=1